MNSAFRHSLAAVAFAAIAVGCKDDATSPPLQTAQTVAKHRWQSTGLASYRLVATRICECAPDAAGPVRITVVNGTVAHVERVDTGAHVDASLWFDVNALFALVDQQIEQMPERLHVTYDGTYGFPTHITYGMIEVDGGATITISDFLTGLPPD